MRRELILCDSCGKPDALPVHINTDRKMDGAGSMETECDRVDLCHKCAVAALSSIYTDRAADFAAGREFVRKWRKKT